MRQVMFGCVATIISGMVVALIAGHIVTGGSFAGTIVHGIHEKTGVRVTFAPRVEVRFMPRLQIILSDVSLVLPSDSDLLSESRVEIGRLHLDIGLGTFLRGDASSIDAVRAEAVRGLVSLGGTRYIRFLRALAIDRITIADSVFEFDLSDYVLTSRLGSAVVEDVSGVLTFDTGMNAEVSGRFREHDWDLNFSASPVGDDGRSPFSFEVKSFAGHLAFVGSTLSDTAARGVIDFYAPKGALALLSRFSIAPTQANDMGLALQGELNIGSSGVRSNRLRLTILERPVTVQLSLSAHAGGTLALALVLEGDAIDLDRLSAYPRARFPNWLQAFDDSTVTLDVSMDRVVRGGETIRNLIFRLNSVGDHFAIEQLSADLPSDSTVLGSGVVRWRDNSPIFEGTISARSGQFIPVLLWAGKTFAVSIPFASHLLAHARPLRGSLITGIVWGRERVHLRDLTARLDGHTYRLDFLVEADGKVRTGHFRLDAERFDLADWGMLDIGGTPQVAHDIETLPIGDWLQATLGVKRGHHYRVAFDLKAASLFAGQLSFGASTMTAVAESGILSIESLTIADYETTEIHVDGTLGHDGSHVYGVLDVDLSARDGRAVLSPFTRLLAPLPLNFADAVRVSGRWELTPSDDPNWPSVALNGSGVIGANTALQFNIAAPVRRFSVNNTTLTASLRVDGTAATVTRLLSLPPLPLPQAQSRAQWRFNLIGQGSGSSAGVNRQNSGAHMSNVSQFSTSLFLGNHQFRYQGMIGGVPGGRQIDGQLTAVGTDLGYFIERKGVLPYRAALNLLWSARDIGFSDLTLELPHGLVSGEGVIKRAASASERALITANMKLANFVLSDDRIKSQIWSSQPIDWRILGDSDATIALTIENMRVQSVNIDNMRAQLKLIQGVLEFDASQVSLFDGSVALNGQLEGGQLLPAFQLEGTFQNFDISEVARVFYGHRFVTARGRGSFDFRARGRTESDMARNLSGTGEVQFGAGTMNFVNADAIVESASPQSFQNHVFLPHADAPETGFSTGRATFRIDNGILVLNDGEIEGLNSSGDPYILARFFVRANVPEQDMRGQLSLAMPTPIPSTDLLVAGALSAPRFIRIAPHAVP